MSLSWPTPFTTKGSGQQKRDAERLACEKVLHTLKQLNVISETYSPRLYSVDDLQQFASRQRMPTLIYVSERMQTQLRKFIDRHKYVCKALAGRQDFLGDGINERSSSYSDYVIDVITGRQLCRLAPSETYERNSDLLASLEMQQNTTDHVLAAVRQTRKILPIYEYKQEIVATIERNPVVIISGETGCGKTTQVPQYILDQFIADQEGVNCNIVATQPRRLSAINVARRVAYERGEELGNTVGFQVRLRQTMPKGKGAILFCSAGILLRRLSRNPKLDGVSHVIVDEAHERDVITDFLLVLLKDIVKECPSLRIIFMSAVMNIDRLVAFFGGCPVLKIPGMTYPVEDFFLPDILKMIGREDLLEPMLTNFKKFRHHLPPPIDYPLVADVITWIHYNRPQGGVLCFLPGWEEIESVRRELAMRLDVDECIVLPLHSRVPFDQQSLIFQPPPPNKRKIVLSTTMAETSITVQDMVYVVDTGRCKEMYFDPQWGATSLQVQWVSRANVQQRRGRVGRTQPGECFCLYTLELMSDMQQFPIPEIKRCSLEKVILDSKVYCTEEKSAAEFLAKCLDPPASDAVRHAVHDLYNRRFLTFAEQLTSLGLCASAFTCHPYIAKAVLYASWMRCLDPVLTVGAHLMEARSEFSIMPGNRMRICETKKHFAKNLNSDHLSFFRLFNAWEDSAYPRKACKYQFCQDHFLNNDVMEFISGLKQILAGHVTDLGLIDDLSSRAGYSPTMSHDEYSGSSEMITATLAAGFEPNFLRRMKGEVVKNRIVDSTVWYKTNNGGKAHVCKESVNHLSGKEPRIEENAWLTYLDITFGNSGYTMARMTSVVSPLAIILFAGCNVIINQVPEAERYLITAVDDPVIMSVDNSKVMRFCCSRRVAGLLQEFRYCINACFQQYISSRKDESSISSEQLDQCENELFALLQTLLKEPCYSPQQAASGENS